LSHRTGSLRGMKRDREQPVVSLLVTDLDNTLYDWFAVWYASFSSMLDVVVRKSGIPRGVLEKEIREVHQRRGTSEYSYLLNELPSLKALHQGQDIAVVYKEALDSFRSARRNASTLYPGVMETLSVIRRSGALVVAYTESLAYYTIDRMRRLGLDGVIDFLYSPPDHDFPEGVSPEMLRTRSPDHYRLERTIHRHTPRGALKPNVAVLGAILDNVGADRERTAYVGDSLMKDIAMAQRVGVIDVFAKYGVVVDQREYDLLRRVSHWSDRDIERERRIAAGEAVEPTYTLERSFSEILEHFRFGGGPSGR
jgi:FMN phosphatase YigB (HAD superfamily)